MVVLKILRYRLKFWAPHKLQIPDLKKNAFGTIIVAFCQLCELPLARGEGEELLTGQDSEKVWGEQVGRSGPRTGTKVPLEPAPREISVQRTKSDFE